MVQRSLLPLLEDYWSPQRTGHQLLQASVVFGQNTLGCRGNGICRVDMVTSKKQKLTPITTAISGQVCTWNPVKISRNKASRMRFELDLEQLHPSVLIKHFKDGLFLVKERFEIPELIIESLSLDQSWVSIGYYNIKEIENALIIDF
jgi:hypothetical protein